MRSVSYTHLVTYPVEVTFKMAEKGGYMAEYIMHDLQRTNDRADYPNLLSLIHIYSMVPLWQRKKSEVTREEYDKFYQEHFGDFAPPQSVITVSAEGAVTYKALLFIPSQPSGQYLSLIHISW